MTTIEAVEQIRALKQGRDRYEQLRAMLLQERLSAYFASYKWPSGSDKAVSGEEFDAAIDAAIADDLRG